LGFLLFPLFALSLSSLPLLHRLFDLFHFVLIQQDLVPFVDLLLFQNVHRVAAQFVLFDQVALGVGIYIHELRARDLLTVQLF